MRFVAFSMGCLLAATPLAASAATVTLQAGASESGKDNREAVPVFFAKILREEPLRLGHRFEARPFAVAGFVDGRDDPGERDSVWLAGAGFRATVAQRPEKHWFVESQVMLNHPDTSSLSGSVQFGHGIGYSFGHVEVMLKHISNARLTGPNDGETMLMLGYGF